MSKLNSNDTYLILNYNPSSVAVSTRDTSYLVHGGTLNAPASLPLTLNEIRYINNVSRVFKNGVLFFDPSIEEAMYEELHIANWREILRDTDIEAILQDPTVEGLERILSITDQMCFERVYGIYIGMKNAGTPISSKVEGILKERKKELARGRAHTKIVVRKIEPVQAATAEQLDALKQELEQMKALLAAATAAKEPEKQPDPPAEKPARSSSNKTSSRNSPKGE